MKSHSDPMTNTVEGLDPKALLPCPFCGAKLVLVETGVWVHPWEENCPADALKVRDDDEVRKANWNRRSLAASPSVGVRVKPLEWKSTDSTSMWASQKWASDVQFWWTYRISRRSNRVHQVRLEGVNYGNADLGRFATWDEAKTAAQADCEARIRSALLISPDTAGLGSTGEATTFDQLKAAVERSRNRDVAGGGWSLNDKETDTALEWIEFLIGIGAPVPKIAGFDEGLQLVWPGNGARHYLMLGDDAEGFVLTVSKSSPPVGNHNG